MTQLKNQVLDAKKVWSELFPFKTGLPLARFL
mgnify:CR=1 FL=1|jgi:hypothetical protein